jgi:putative acetyltransferase
MDDVQRAYFDNHGIFLVMLEDDELIGTGAVCRINSQICELKRVWLLFEYHGRGLGYRMMQQLLSFARVQGYRKIRLETDRNHQAHAYHFYKRVGFHEIPRYSENEEDAAMEMLL